MTGHMRVEQVAKCRGILSKMGDRHHEVAPGISDQTLNSAFIVALRWSPNPLGPGFMLRAMPCFRIDDGQRVGVITISTRRFCALPAAVAFVVIGSR